MKKQGLLVSIVGALAIPVSAQVMTTQPVGFEVIQLKPNQFNVIGQRLQAPIVAKGVLEAVTATTVTDNEVNFQEKLTPGRIYALEITSGTYSGLVFEATAGTGSTLNVGNDLTTEVAAGATYTLRPARTLAELFGTVNTPLQKGLNSSNADVIWIPDGIGGYTKYFLSSLDNTWKTEVGAAAPNVSILYTDGVYIEKRSLSGTLVIHGEVKKSSTSATVIQGFNLLSTIYPAGATLQNIGLEDDVQRGFTTIHADTIWIPEGAGNYGMYFLNNSGVWKRANAPAGDAPPNVPLTPGVLYERRGGTSKTISLTPPANYSGL